MKLWTTFALSLGGTLITGSLLTSVLVPQSPTIDPDAVRTVEFTRDAPCSTCFTADNPTGAWTP